ncbi:hypothetical protein D0867_10701 [Hortaea werneckii]|uniref:Uncharacterized protein n=2 Tax=Hortaea werneckii TaxID=91943 RepID=A0A3M6YK25_HORWE|nr:hypothetical protein D0867_10701 [Hortaea werneckii]
MPISIGAADTTWPAPPSPRSPPLSSLHAAATINAGLHRSPSNASPSNNLHPAMERRRSSLLNNFNMNDPTIPAPGEMQQNSSNNTSPSSRRRSLAFPPASPPHHRHQSLGELHQELENEQEAQVNRLLHMIRIQQDQLAAFQQRQQSPLLPSTSTSTSQTSSPEPSSASNLISTTLLPSQSQPCSTTTTTTSPPGPPHVLPRRPSATQPSHPVSSISHGTTSSPPPAAAFPPVSGSDTWFGGTTTMMRDETAFYQAETQTLMRENRMLKCRVRELALLRLTSETVPPSIKGWKANNSSEMVERQVAELNPVSSIGSDSR